jgi:hypothetical protein
MNRGAYIVYGLKEREDSDLLHYVGLTFTGHMTVEERVAARLEAHWSERHRHGAKADWLKSLKRRPVAIILGIVPTRSRARKNITPSKAGNLERFWIRSLSREGHPLTNRTHVFGGRSAA